MKMSDKCKNYAMSFFFSFVPDEWSYDDLTHYLRLQDGDFNEMVSNLNLEDELAVWEPFEDYNPSWVADQMDMMVAQLWESFSGSKLTWYQFEEQFK